MQCNLIGLFRSVVWTNTNYCKITTKKKEKVELCLRRQIPANDQGVQAIHDLTYSYLTRILRVCPPDLVNVLYTQRTSTLQHTYRINYWMEFTQGTLKKKTQKSIIFFFFFFFFPIKSTLCSIIAHV